MAFLTPITIIEVAVLSTMLIRAAAFLLVPRLQRVHPTLVFDILSLEIMSIPVLLALAIATGSALFRNAFEQVFVAWVFALILIGPSLMLSRFSRALVQGASLSLLLPSAAAIYGILWSLQGLPGPTQGSSGPVAFVETYFGGITQRTASVVSSPLVAVAGIAGFISLALYATQTHGRVATLRVPSLLITLIGIVGALVWVAGFSTFSNSTILLSVPPTAIGGVIWWVTRES